MHGIQYLVSSIVIKMRRNRIFAKLGLREKPHSFLAAYQIQNTKYQIPRAKYKATIAASFTAFFIAITLFSSANAAELSLSRDLITTSNPGVGADHTITFRATSAVPPSGKIRIVFEGTFDTPAGFDFEEVDLATSSISSGPYADRALSALPSATDDGVTAVLGTSSQITITLNSTRGISAGEYIKLELGANATFGAVGSDRILNPVFATGTTNTVSYHIRLKTYTAADVLIDDGSPLVVIVPVISMLADTNDTVPPFRSNGLPTGTIPSGITQAEISLNTDEYATCRYATSTGIAYDSMLNTFTTTNATFHVTLIGGLQDGQTYSFYVRCRDFANNKNPDDFPIIFSVANPPLPPDTEPPGGGGGAGSGGGRGDGSGGGTGTGVGPNTGPGSGEGFPYPSALPPASLSISGYGYPKSLVTMLRDGTTEQTLTPGSSGEFNFNIPSINQGVYTFGVYAVDVTGKRSATFPSTISLINGTKNAIAKIILPPTVSLGKSAVAPGESAPISGYAAPRSSVKVQLAPQSRASEGQSSLEVTVTSDVNGLWSARADTGGLSVGTYEVRARMTVAGIGTSGQSSPAFLGVGQNPSVDFGNRADLNRDGKVNLVDFSILLFNWGTADPIADINSDGVVNLTDFSILLFNWTG